MSDPEPLTPLRDLIVELTQKHVSQAVKESTKQAIRKQGIKLSKSQLHKFEDKIKHLNDQEKIEKLKEPLEEVKKTITQEGIEKKSLDKIADTINKGMNAKIPLGMSISSKVAIMIAILGLGIISTLFILFPGSGEQIIDSTIATAAGILGTKGIGGDNNTTVLRTCPECNGRGIVEHQVEQPRTCPICEGTGELVGGICTKCEGTGIWGTELVTKTENCIDCGGDGTLNPGDPGY